MISKELFESIYDMKINRLEVDEYSNIWIDIDSKHLSRFDSLNNFSFKCKQWAWDNGYQIRSSFRSVTMDSRPYGELIDCTAIDVPDGIVYNMIATYGAEDDETEIDVIIRLSEWVLEKLNDK